jgi:hypothetical protein
LRELGDVTRPQGNVVAKRQILPYRDALGRGDVTNAAIVELDLSQRGGMSRAVNQIYHLTNLVIDTGDPVRRRETMTRDLVLRTRTAAL